MSFIINTFNLDYFMSLRYTEFVTRFGTMEYVEDFNNFDIDLILSKFEFVSLNIKVHLVQFVWNYFMERLVLVLFNNGL